VKRRTFVFALSMLAIAPRVLAQTAPTGATRTQIDVALASASLAALLARYGDQHPDVVAARARVASLSQSLRDARARHETIDAGAVSTSIEAELADVRARLAEFGTRCGAGHLDVQTARARETALADALAHVTSDGYFAP
jgi:uncharacterized protein involved in exopolysaccharide biosynthesis